MLTAKQPVLRRFWYPVISMSLLKQGPKSFTLMEQPLVLWLDAQGQPAAAEDRCCHRSAQLSQGEAIAGNIRCPYHGWSFNSEGVCVKVPQLEQGTIPRTYRVQAYPCQERYGYVWVCLGDPLDGIPEIPEASTGFRLIPEFYETWRTSGLRIMENSFDIAHGHFVHASSWGDQSNPVPPRIDQIVDTESGFMMRHWIEVLNPELQQQNLGIQADKTIRTNELRWFMPFARTLKIQYPNGLIHLIFTAATPIDDRTSQLVQFCLRNDTEADTKSSDVIAFDRTVTQEDRDILETTDYDVPLDISEEQHMASDKPGILMRHRLAALLKAHGEVEQRQSHLT